MLQDQTWEALKVWSISYDWYAQPVTCHPCPLHFPLRHPHLSSSPLPCCPRGAWLLPPHTLVLLLPLPRRVWPPPVLFPEASCGSAGAGCWTSHADRLRWRQEQRGEFRVVEAKQGWQTQSDKWNSILALFMEDFYNKMCTLNTITTQKTQV